jgi:uncharacterized NAD-dependent epimerase/dehydratase family protein
MYDSCRGTAIVLTGDQLNTNNAKTAHGLARGSDRFEILAIIDEASAGLSADAIIPAARPIPVFASLAIFLQSGLSMPAYAIIGVAARGGMLPLSIRPEVERCLEKGISIVNGLHQPLSADPVLAGLADANKASIFDIRKPKSFEDLHFWDGSIQQVKCPKIAVLGTDCAIGKRTTARILVQALRTEGLKAEMIYTGQTGWMQGAKYGFIFDSTLNDFISGELEAAVVNCYRDLAPDIIFIEGQSSLRNPSGPCGSEMLLSAAADAVVLQVIPGRKHFKGLENYPASLPEPAEEIALIRHYGVEVMALSINTMGISTEDALLYASNLEQELNIPVFLPLEQGAQAIIPRLKSYLSTYEN